jgi:glycosyltransferase involved in cell wall biosynthesis
LGLPEDKNVLLFVSSWANNPIKGFDLLDQAFSHLAEADRKNCVIAMLGAHGGENDMHGMPVFHLGSREGDEELAAVYQAADVFLCPSREDNYPNTVLEASACGVPSVAFNIGGLPDLIDHHESGMLAEPYNPVEFASCLVDTLRKCSSLGDAARSKVARQNDSELHATELINLYSTVIAKASS